MPHEGPPSPSEGQDALDKAKEWLISGGELSDELLYELEAMPEPLETVKILSKTAVNAENSQDAKNRFVQLIIRMSAHAED